MTEVPESYQNYRIKLNLALKNLDYRSVIALESKMMEALSSKKQVFIFGNGGSAANAMHIANDFIYGIRKEMGGALRINALPSNTSVITCLANDEGYDQIFVRQLSNLANHDDLVIALSGSGNSKNILEAIIWSNDNGLFTFSILGFDGGDAKKISKASIHTPVNDMQISEDLQLIICHMIMQSMCNRLNHDIT
ncbi:MAG: phosphoheptose isomerase [Candidatus Pelagibacter sp.]|nr:phosphoheptose isomerase [Candidatus Pelagibacter sp.]